jgi:hypothetical protein
MEREMLHVLEQHNAVHLIFIRYVPNSNLSQGTETLG